MNILGIMGSYRKGHTIDTLLDRMLEGARSMGPDIQTDKIVLIDRHIDYCRNCSACKSDDPSKPYTACVIEDDMQDLYPMIANADAFIFATPVNMGYATAVVKTFLERLCWVMAKPGRYPLKGCPEPRCTRKRYAAILVSAGLIPAFLRRFCDEATPMIKDFCRWNLNAKSIGTLYAGAVDKVGVQAYMEPAYRFGQKLVSAAR